MLVAGFPAGPWGTNCWVAATAPGAECFVVDPGMDSIEPLKALLAEHRLKPIAVVVTHGHIDHMFSVTPIADGYDIPAVVSKLDRKLLGQPELAMGPQGLAIVAQLGATFVEPKQVIELGVEQTISLAGLDIRAQHAPGHTPGSTVFSVNHDRPRLFAGDVLFRGSIGRTDLPGGDSAAMFQSLERVIKTADPETLVHCGHGENTTIAHELATNPYLNGGR